MNKITYLMTIVLFVVCGTFSAQAESPLKASEIKKFITVMGPLKLLGEKYDMDNDPDANVNEMNMETFSPMTNSLKTIRGHKAYSEFMAILKKAGFSSDQEWATVGDKIIRAYAAIQMSREMSPEQIKEMNKSIAEIKNNEYLSPEMKKQMLDSMQQAMAMAKNVANSSKADQETLKPYLPKLTKLFEDE